MNFSPQIMNKYNTLLPKKVFKFMEPEFLKRLERNKTFFINHLNNYKEIELGSEIGDNNEGKLNTEFKIEEYIFNTSDNPKNPNFELAFHNFQNGIKIGEGCSNISLSNVMISNSYVDDNYYVYCSCLEDDKYTKKEFGRSTLIIENFPMFLHHLNKKLIKKDVRLVIADACIYMPGRKKIFTEKDNEFALYYPFLVKDKRYSYQKEYRVIWKRVDNKKIEKPMFIKCPEALKYCSFQYC